MPFQFATCERARALGFLKKFYPSAAIEDSEGSAKAVLDYVERDVIRIPDPDFHTGAILPSKNYAQADAADVLRTLQDFHAQAMSSIVVSA